MLVYQRVLLSLLLFNIIPFFVGEFSAFSLSGRTRLLGLWEQHRLHGLLPAARGDAHSTGRWGMWGKQCHSYQP